MDVPFLVQTPTFNIYTPFSTKTPLWGPISTVGLLRNFRLKPGLALDVHYDTSSAVAEMGDRLATIDMGRKLGNCAPFFLGGGAGSI